MCRTFKTPNTGLWSRVLAVTGHNDHWTKELSQREPKSICFSVDTVLCLGTIVHLHGYRRYILLRTGRLQTGELTSYSIRINAVDNGYPVFIGSVCVNQVSCDLIYPRWKSALLLVLWPWQALPHYGKRGLSQILLCSIWRTRSDRRVILWNSA